MALDPIIQKTADKYNLGIKVHSTEHWFCKLLSYLTWLRSCGRLTPSRWRENIFLSIGTHHFYADYHPAFIINNVIPHEARHTYHCYILGACIHPNLGAPLYYLLYLLFPLPAVLALFRLAAECDCIYHTWKHQISSGVTTYPDMLRDVEFRSNSLSNVVYGYTAPHFICMHVLHWLADKAHAKYGYKDWLI